MDEALCALSLGGNVGDVARAFAYALMRLETSSHIELVATSSVWRTKAWGKTDQPDFLNMAALLRTRLRPQELLALCLAIETSRGRARDVRWGPRTLDLDILFYGDLRLDTADLTLPHPHLQQRAFVLAPLAQIAPGHVIDGVSVADWLSAVDISDIRIDDPATQFISQR